MKLYYSKSTIAKEAKYLEVKDSHFTGKGLFTKKDIKKGEWICTYMGEYVDNDEALRRCDEGIDQFLVETVNDGILDSMPIFCHAMYANDAAGLTRQPGIRNNAEIGILEGGPRMIATRNIKAGDEILVSYGRVYWNNVKRRLKSEGKL